MSNFSNYLFQTIGIENTTEISSTIGSMIGNTIENPQDTPTENVTHKKCSGMKGTIFFVLNTPSGKTLIMS
jgi:hypothetical protein